MSRVRFWIVTAIVILVVVAVWKFIDLRTQPPPPPAAQKVNGDK